MLLTIGVESPPDADWPATDLGYLLAKNPARVQPFSLPFGTATVFYPEADERRCTAALLVDVDPIGLVRARGRDTSEAFALTQYVNDWPYAASSLLSVALARLFGTALHGRCAARPELADTPLRLRCGVPSVPVSPPSDSGRVEFVERIFGPLGWRVGSTAVPLDPTLARVWQGTPEAEGWLESRYLDLDLEGEHLLRDALSHLYVLLPVLGGAKHYRIAPDEVDKLLRAGESWLPGHPERELITRRYLRHRRSLVRTALERLAEVDDLPETALDEIDAAEDIATAPSTTEVGETDEVGETTEPTVPLATQRREAVMSALREVDAHRVADLGCGGGALLRDLIDDARFTEILGVDVSTRALRTAERRLHLDRLPERVARRLTLCQGALTYTDPRLRGYDAAVLMEVIEHVDPPRLGALEHAVFGDARPATVVVTTPNVEYNVRYEGLPAGAPRHGDHRFEWTREQFRAWATHTAERHGYLVEFRPVGTEDESVGAPTQLGLFRRILTDSPTQDESAKTHATSGGAA